MQRYRYAEDVTPPAPFVYAAMANPESSETTEELSAQLDCGADRTVVPNSVVQRLQLKTMRAIQVAGLDSRVRIVNTHVVRITIRGLEPILVEALAADEPCLLIGRDVLNTLRVVLDGPNRILEIG